MTKYLDADNKIGAAIEELAVGSGRIPDRLKAAWGRVAVLGTAGVDVPPNIKPEVDELRARLAAEAGPNAIAKAVEKLTEEECVDEARRLLRWSDSVRAAISAELEAERK